MISYPLQEVFRQSTGLPHEGCHGYRRVGLYFSFGGRRKTRSGGELLNGGQKRALSPRQDDLHPGATLDEEKTRNGKGENCRLCLHHREKVGIPQPNRLQKPPPPRPKHDPPDKVRPPSIPARIMEEKPSAPRTIIRTAMRQLVTTGQLSHPYHLIYSHHTYVPAMQYLVLKAVMEYFYEPTCVAPVGTLLQYDDYLQMQGASPADIERYLGSKAAELLENKLKSDFGLVNSVSNGGFTLEEVHGDIFDQDKDFSLRTASAKTLKCLGALRSTSSESWVGRRAPSPKKASSEVAVFERSGRHNLLYRHKAQL
ncbi:hypothetical protein U1Q18_050792 [Sarracenia purpurea var. burkii]